jgi:hypothetical protein
VSDVKIVQRLPVYASNGDEVDLLVDPLALYGGPLLWRCRFRKSTPQPYQWHAIAPQPLYAEDSPQRMAASVTAGAWTNSGTSLRIVVPAPGVYFTEGDTSQYGNTAATNDHHTAPSVNGVAPTGIALTRMIHSSNGQWTRMHFAEPVTVPLPGGFVEMMHRVGSFTANVYRQGASLSLRPIRLGP